MAQESTEMKLCPDCNTKKDIIEFTYSHRILVRCKTCQNEQRCKKRKEAKSNAENTTKLCKECSKEKKGSEFEFGTLTCKKCFSEKDKEANHRPTADDPDKTCRVCETTK